MDQEILPGVGNIIKNEALFDAGIMEIKRCKGCACCQDLCKKGINKCENLFFDK